jgi:hypothetical protein
MDVGFRPYLSPTDEDGRVILYYGFYNRHLDYINNVQDEGGYYVITGLPPIVKALHPLLLAEGTQLLLLSRIGELTVISLQYPQGMILESPPIADVMADNNSRCYVIDIYHNLHAVNINDIQLFDGHIPNVLMASMIDDVFCLAVIDNRTFRVFEGNDLNRLVYTHKLDYDVVFLRDHTMITSEGEVINIIYKDRNGTIRCEFKVRFTIPHTFKYVGQYIDKLIHRQAFIFTIDYDGKLICWDDYNEMYVIEGKYNKLIDIDMDSTIAEREDGKYVDLVGKYENNEVYTKLFSLPFKLFSFQEWRKIQRVNKKSARKV